MPVHDWSKVDAGLFHHFHQSWTCRLCDALNRELLPAGYSALIEGKVTGVEPDVMAVAGRARPDRPRGAGLRLREAPPQVEHVSQPVTDAEAYARKANRVTVRYKDRRLVAMIEVVSPGNKDRAASVVQFVNKAVGLLLRGVNLLVIDLLPPTAHDPAGLYKRIWDHVRDEPFALPPDRPLVLAACLGEPVPEAYVQPIGVGQPLPAMPLFLDDEEYVSTPLEETYNQTWDCFPDEFRDDVLNPG